MTAYRINPGVEKALADFELPEKLGFGQVLAPLMYQADYRNGEWQQGELLPYGDIRMPPGAGALHFAEQVFEGMKAYRVAREEPNFFRPRDHWARLNRSARRIALPELPWERFREGISSVAASCSACMPGGRGQALYLRPFLSGLDLAFTIKSSQNVRFTVFASPCEAYSAGPMRIMIERDDIRATRGGTGAVKTGANYAASLRSSGQAREHGYDISLWLDGQSRGLIEELSGMNLFAVINGELHTPELTDTILPGITRDSLIQLAREQGFVVHERSMPIADLVRDIQSGACSEVFACGTAAIVSPVSVLGEADGSMVELREVDRVAADLRAQLLDIQERRVGDPFGWTEPAA